MSTRWGSGDYVVLGLTAIRPRPLFRTFVPLDSGLSVLYGRNGAGKSRILEALEAAVTGQEGRAWSWLHIRMRDVALGEDEGLTGALLKALPSVRLPGRPRANPTPAQRLEERIAHALRRVWDDWIGEEAADLAREVARAGHLALIPVGGHGEHTWRVFVAGLPGDDTPLFNARAAAYSQAWQAALLASTDDERMEALDSALMEFGLKDEADVDESDPVPFAEPGRPELLVELSPLRLTGPLCDLYGPPRGSLEDQTLARLLHRKGSLVRRKVLIAGTQDLDVSVVEDLEHLSIRASDLYDLVLENAPQLICQFAPVEEWLTGASLRWSARVANVGQPLPLSDLSQAQQRWAEIAIAATLVEFDASGGRALMLLDEPELALHSLAVRTMAQGLQRLADVINVDIVAATHAGALLESTKAHLLHVLRGVTGTTAVHRISGIDEDDALLMGLGKSELLQLTRLFVVVEGVHDEIVVKEACERELESARARVIPTRGVTGLASLLDAQFLLRFSDAHFLVVIDNVDPDFVRGAWQDAQEIYRRTRDADAPWELLKAAFPGRKSSENRFLRELMLSAIVQDQAHRLGFQTLAQPDVICYLPVSSFTSKAATWHDVLTAHAHQGGGKSLKSWLGETHGSTFEDDDIRSAARALDVVPDDLVLLAAAIQAYAEGPA